MFACLRFRVFACSRVRVFACLCVFFVRASEHTQDSTISHIRLFIVIPFSMNLTLTAQTDGSV